MINGERIYTVGLKYMYRIPVKKDDGKDLPRLWKFRVTRNSGFSESGAQCILGECGPLKEEGYFEP